MTSVSNQTQPVTRKPNTTVQSDKLADPAVPSNVKTASSNQKSFFDVMVSKIETAVVNASNNIVEALVASNKRLITRRLASPGQFSPGSSNYTNRPIITVVKNSTGAAASTEVPVGDFSDWFLSSVQEQDLERTDVTETFGAPHIFSSDRFTRKIVFSGMVRTTAHNFAGAIQVDRVPQHVLLRNFYEKFLRATAQAQMDYFTRITVDGDIYEGYITNLQLPRDAGAEMVMPFAMTMICVRRSNVRDADAIGALSVFKAKPATQMLPAFASASMKDATGDFKLQIEANNTISDTIVIVNVGKVNQDGTYLGVKPVIKIHASYSGQVITVKGSGVDVWSVKYVEGKTPVSGTSCREGARDITLELASFAKLAASAESDGQASFDLQFSAGGKAGPTLRIVSVSTDKPQIKIKALKLRMANGALIEGIVESNESCKLSLPNARSHFVQLSPGIWDAIFSLEVELSTLDLVTLTADQLASPLSSYCKIQQFLARALLRGSVLVNSSVQLDYATSPTEVDVSSMTITSTEPGVVKFENLKFSLNTTSDVAQVNPFVLTESIELVLQPQIALPGFDVLEVDVRTAFDMGSATLLKQLFSSIKAFKNPTTGNKWFLGTGRIGEAAGKPARTYSAFLVLDYSAETREYNLSDAMLRSLMATATFTVQYNQGVLAGRFAQIGGTGVLNINGGVRQFIISIQQGQTTPQNAMTVSIDFSDLKATAADSKDDINAVMNVLENPTSVTLTFPPIYNMPVQQVTFK